MVFSQLIFNFIITKFLIVFITVECESIITCPKDLSDIKVVGQLFNSKNYYMHSKLFIGNSTVHLLPFGVIPAKTGFVNRFREM